MNEQRAKEILSQRNAIPDEGGLWNLGWYLEWNSGDKEAVLDGEFEAEELEAIAWWMRNKSK